jgi:hypothetical protein
LATCQQVSPPTHLLRTFLTIDRAIHVIHAVSRLSDMLSPAQPIISPGVLQTAVYISIRTTMAIKQTLPLLQAIPLTWRQAAILLVRKQIGLSMLFVSDSQTSCPLIKPTRRKRLRATPTSHGSCPSKSRLESAEHLWSPPHRLFLFGCGVGCILGADASAFPFSSTVF